MKIVSIIHKSLKEQLRSFWVLLLTLSMGPFFIFVYYLIMQSSEPQYSLIIINKDKGAFVQGQQINHGQYLTAIFKEAKKDSSKLPFIVNISDDKSDCIEKLKNKKADAVIIIPELFSETIIARSGNDSSLVSQFEFIGDLTNTSYIVSAVWAGEIINQYANHVTKSKRIVDVKETALGTSAKINNFDLMVPGLLIIAIIMLMFTSGIAFVSEVENKTIMRLKLSKVSTFEFIGGVGIVQLIVGVISVLLTLLTAILLGFNYAGSLMILILISVLSSMSIISFSLIIAAFTKSANEILVVGNFPMFLFMFFTGAAFPLKSEALFTIADYPITLQGLMTPTHAISALNKTLIMNMSISSIIPEIIAILTLTIIYFLIGGIAFKKRHLKLM